MSSDFLISSATGATKFSIAHEKLYVLVVTQDNAKLLEQLKLEFKQIVNWNEYQLNVEQIFHNSFLNYFIDFHFQGVNGFSVLTVENTTDRAANSGYYFFGQPVKLI